MKKPLFMPKEFIEYCRDDETEQIYATRWYSYIAIGPLKKFEKVDFNDPRWDADNAEDLYRWLRERKKMWIHPDSTVLNKTQWD